MSSAVESTALPTRARAITAAIMPTTTTTPDVLMGHPFRSQNEQEAGRFKAGTLVDVAVTC